jgi:DNA primase
LDARRYGYILSSRWKTRIRRPARDPEHYILSAQGNRRGRIFLDYLRNGRGTTAIGTYSSRVRPDFPIAAPVTWSRIEGGIRPDAFTMKRPFRARSESPNHLFESAPDQGAATPETPRR